MVNTRIDAELAAAVQNALQTLLPQIRAKIREEFRTGSGPSGSGGNPPPVTIHTCLLKYALMTRHNYDITVFFTKRVITIMVFRAEGFRPVGSKDLTCEDWMVNTRTDTELTAAVQNALQALLPRFAQRFARSSVPERLKREYHSILQTNTETITKFMQCFLQLAGFLEEAAAAGSAKEQAKNFQWGLRRSTLNHLMCILYTDVAQVANAARNYKILHERDDDGAERPDKRRVVIGINRQTQQSSYRNHGHNNDRHGSDRNSSNGRDQRNWGQQSNRPVNSGFQQSRGPSEGYSYPVCTTCGRRHQGECR
nr:hypothetical protein [Tanacetum cinerariifolium]